MKFCLLNNFIHHKSGSIEYKQTNITPFTSLQQLAVMWSLALLLGYPRTTSSTARPGP